MIQDLRLLFLPASVLLLVSCAGSGGDGWVDLEPGFSEPGEEIRIEGTIRHLEIEGGLFVIRDPEGTTYNPTNLPEAFRSEGMRVEAELRLRDDMMSIGMAGPLVDLLRIREAP